MISKAYSGFLLLCTEHQDYITYLYIATGEIFFMEKAEMRAIYSASSMSKYSASDRITLTNMGMEMILNYKRGNIFRSPQGRERKHKENLSVLSKKTAAARFIKSVAIKVTAPGILHNTVTIKISEINVYKAPVFDLVVPEDLKEKILDYHRHPSKFTSSKKIKKIAEMKGEMKYAMEVPTIKPKGKKSTMKHASTVVRKDRHLMKHVPRPLTAKATPCYIHPVMNRNYVNVIVEKRERCRKFFRKFYSEDPDYVKLLEKDKEIVKKDRNEKTIKIATDRINVLEYLKLQPVIRGIIDSIITQSEMTEIYSYLTVNEVLFDILMKIFPINCYGLLSDLAIIQDGFSLVMPTIAVTMGYTTMNVTSMMTRRQTSLVIQLTMGETVETITITPIIKPPLSIAVEGRKIFGPVEKDSKDEKRIAKYCILEGGFKKKYDRLSVEQEAAFDNDKFAISDELEAKMDKLCLQYVRRQFRKGLPVLVTDYY
jgi:hypothetical protein